MARSAYVFPWKSFVKRLIPVFSLLIMLAGVAAFAQTDAPGYVMRYADVNDTQLDFAIEYLLKQLADNGGKWDIPETPAFPYKIKPYMSGLRP